MRAVRIHTPGGPEVLQVEEIPIPQPGPGTALVRLTAIGVNYIDIYHRSGLYKLPLPATLGMEGAGAVEAVGEGVTEVKPGDRVAWAMHIGSYAEYAVVPASRLVPVPDGVSDETAAAIMLQGMTAHYLTHSTYPLRPGDKVLVHAAAGGVGLLLIQIAKMRGATVYGTVGSPAKAQAAYQAGADHVFLYNEQDFVAAVRELTNGQGVQVVYDSVGQATFAGSLKCLAPRGYLVLFGQSSGPVAPVDPQVLSAHGSVFLTRPSLAHYTLTRDETVARARDLFTWLAEGKLKLAIDSRLPLDQAAEAHRRLEGRATSGKVLLVPA